MLIPFSKCVELIGPINGIIHVGAHVGEEAKDYCDHGVKKVLWVEANKNLMKHLYDNVKMLPMKSEFVNEVLGDVDGKKVTFNVTNDNQCSSILPFGTLNQHHPNIHIVERRDLTAKRFDSFYKEKQAFLNMFEYDFINLDVQGAELHVLKGFGNLFQQFPNIKAIYCEVNEEALYEGTALMPEIDVYLMQFGFHRKLTKITEFHWGDALYVRR
jgi:FkbM family methyltransferase